jgi:hypothetical protein
MLVAVIMMSTLWSVKHGMEASSANVITGSICGQQPPTGFYAAEQDADCPGLLVTPPPAAPLAAPNHPPTQLHHQLRWLGPT